MKTVKFFTLGCKVNQYDTQEIRERLLHQGFKEMNNGSKADLYVVNTCTVTHGADSDSLGFIRRARRENPKAKVIVTGCLAELDAKRIKEAEPKAKIVKKQGLSPEGTVPVFGIRKGISGFQGHTRAFLKIQDGCNNFCSYCKVPLVRGKSRSKPLNQIKEEARRLAKNSFKEIVLCGICLGAYGKDLKAGTPLRENRPCLVDAIQELEKIDGILRIRLSSIEAADISDELIHKIAESKKLCRHLHIPIQSGDDEILKKMNRKYTQGEYTSLINKIKSKIPDIAITTDVLVGFPGETEENFQNTIGLIQKINPLKVHIFPYSPREGTPAHDFKNKVDPKEIKRRISCLEKVSRGRSLEYKKRFVNKVADVLIEAESREKPGYWEGLTDTYLKVFIKSKISLKNKFIPLKLKEMFQDSFLAEFAK